MAFPVERREHGHRAPFHSDIPPGDRLSCVDAGSRYCPCALAPLGECIECSLMRGEAICACRWPGACILEHAKWREQGEVRQSRLVPVLRSAVRPDGTIALTVRVSPLLAAELQSPGSFVFARRDDNPHFDAPFAVIQASPAKRELTLVFRTLGPKTKSLRTHDGFIWLRGPYWNGIAGRGFIDAACGKKCLLVAGGVSVAILPNLAASLLRRSNSVTVVLALPLGLHVSDFLPQEAIETVEMSFPEDRPRLLALMKDRSPDLVFGGGGRLLQLMVNELVGELPVMPDKAFAQDHNMCCGEGICGACIEMVKGKPVRTCKTMR